MGTAPPSLTIRFGSFACQVEGVEDPVAMLRAILALLESLPPALRDDLGPADAALCQAVNARLGPKGLQVTAAAAAQDRPAAQEGPAAQEWPAAQAHAQPIKAQADNPQGPAEEGKGQTVQGQRPEAAESRARTAATPARHGADGAGGYRGNPGESRRLAWVGGLDDEAIGPLDRQGLRPDQPMGDAVPGADTGAEQRQPPRRARARLVCLPRAALEDDQSLTLALAAQMALEGHGHRALTAAFGQAGYAGGPEDRAGLDRLVASANLRLDEADNRRRLSAIKHLKAAVAATFAERAIGRGLGRGLGRSLGQGLARLGQARTAEPPPPPPPPAPPPARPKAGQGMRPGMGTGMGTGMAPGHAAPSLAGSGQDSTG